MGELIPEANNTVPEQDTVLSIDASYTFERTDNGVFLVVSYEQGSGAPLIPELVAYDIVRRGISEQSLVVLLTRFRKKRRCSN
jgi:hypothetical protein